MLAGQDGGYDTVSSFFSEAFGTTIEVAGDTSHADRPAPTRSRLDVPGAVTSALNALAIWMANVPTPRDAPLTSTLGSSSPLSRKSCRAVSVATGTTAAPSKVTFAGFAATASRTFTYSANAPLLAPNTSSPGRKRVTSLPTAPTVPAKSTPSARDIGLSNPNCGEVSAFEFGLDLILDGLKKIQHAA